MRIIPTAKIKEENNREMYYTNNNGKVNDIYGTRPLPSASPQRDGLAGGKREKWREFPNLGKWLQKEQIKELFPHRVGEEMEDLAYELKHLNRLNYPIVLDPKNSSFIDVAIHAYLRQRLSIETIKKRIRYAKFMENHPCPVDFRKPSYENFVRHMDYREQVEKASPHALAHERKTWLMFLRAWGLEKQWPQYKLPKSPKFKDPHIPSPEMVYKQINHTYSKDPYTNALIQYLHCHSYAFGWRMESEPCAMTVDNVRFSEGYVIITQPKLNNSDRIIIPEKPFFTSRRHKSLKNWIDYWRPKVENQYSGNYLYLKPDGKTFTKDAMRMMLTRATRKIDPNYRPYNVRHWCAIARLIEWDLNIIKVRDFLGHEKIETTMGYLRTAKQFYTRDNRSWLKRMLRSSRGQNPLKSAEKNCINRIGKTKVWPENLYFTWNFSLCDEWARQDLNLRPTGYEPVAPPD